MSYELQPDETVADGLRRCAVEQLDRAIDALQEGLDDDPAKAVHTGRKALKQERALLRLARGAMPRSVRSAENDAFRNIGRTLSGPRDAEVMLGTFDSVAAQDGALPDATRKSLRRMLVDRRPEVPPEALERQVLALRQARERAQEWELDGEDWSALKPGLMRTFRRGRRAMRAARDDPTMEKLHEWRKRVKDLWYHLRLLGEVGGPMVQGQAEEASYLADLLGEDHDLVVLRDTLLAPPLSPASVRSLLQQIDRRREGLQGQAFAVGSRLYAEKPKPFRRRMKRCWKAGRRAAAISAPAQDRAPEPEPRAVRDAVRNA